MTRRKLTKIDEFAQAFINQNGCSISPGEYEYVSTGATLIRQHLENFFQGTGAQPPELKTVKNWFYSDCPDWAIAVLSRALISRNEETPQ
ncbi:hypothetical protein [Nodularia sp. LEGE 04288]|uniref:hypothetical protein n=2 Tax=unclassified Nodularia (in: cyanobacteria) TaxID=2656917 RepID=UPI001D120DC1|nr:hypothetical protein [Nodularia sp. LEGE 04288]MCC2692866.1 hypothetical protein [Nodularia sp. LEGE 04288]